MVKSSQKQPPEWTGQVERPRRPDGSISTWCSLRFFCFPSGPLSTIAFDHHYMHKKDHRSLGYPSQKLMLYIKYPYPCLESLYRPRPRQPRACQSDPLPSPSPEDPPRPPHWASISSSPGHPSTPRADPDTPSAHRPNFYYLVNSPYLYPNPPR